MVVLGTMDIGKNDVLPESSKLKAQKSSGPNKVYAITLIKEKVKV